MKLTIFATAWSDSHLLKNEKEICDEVGSPENLSGWFWIKEPSNILKFFEVSRNSTFGFAAQARISLTKRELSEIDYFKIIPSEIPKLTPKQDELLFWENSNQPEYDKGGYGPIMLARSANIDSKPNLRGDTIYLISDALGEWISTEENVKTLVDAGCEFEDTPEIGISKENSRIRLLVAKHFTPAVILDNSISIRRQEESEYQDIRTRYFQSGLLTYESLESHPPLMRIADPISTNASPDWIAHRSILEILKEPKGARYGAQPILETGTQIYRKYHSIWDQLIKSSSANDKNTIYSY